MVNREEFFRRNDKIVVRQIAGETMLIPIHQTGVDLQKVYLLNETAAAVWQHLVSPQSLRGLIETLAQEFDASPAALKVDLVELLDELVALDFVSQVEVQG